MSFARAAVFVEAGAPLELRAFALPLLQAGETLVEIIACTLCGSDLHTLRGKRSVPTPTVLGHEILGRIAAFGPETRACDAFGLPLAIGDRVTWCLVANCGECFFCRHDLPQKCVQQLKYGHEPLRPGYELTGGLATHCRLARGTALFRVPDDLPNAVACPANCAAATVAAALEAAGNFASNHAANHVLVLGAGMLGVTAIAWTRARGAAVIACDVLAERLELAEQFGTERTCFLPDLAAVVAAATEGRGVDLLLEFTGSPAAFEAALPLVRMGGAAVLVGSVFPSPPYPLSLEQLVRRCLTLRGVHNYAPRHLHQALDFLAAQRDLPFASLVAPWRPLEDLNASLAALPTPTSLRLGIAPAV